MARGYGILLPFAVAVLIRSCNSALGEQKQNLNLSAPYCLLEHGILAILFKVYGYITLFSTIFFKGKQLS